MDTEPIYCAEQIVVPPDLADVLRAYTKEVIRSQPDNLLEFSAKYFRNLADVASSVDASSSAPSVEQLQLLRKRIGSGQHTMTPEQVYAVAAQIGLAKGVVAKVLTAGKFGSSVNTDKFLFLLLVLSCNSFAAVLQGLFQVFGSSMESQQFQTLISFLAPDMDPDITTAFLSELNSQLLDVTSITYEDAAAVPCIQQKLQQ